MGIELRAEPPDSAVSHGLQEAFFAEMAKRYPGWSPASSQSVHYSELAPPTGAWLVAYINDAPVGCGGVQPLDVHTAEIRRIYLSPKARGHGVGRELLSALEQHARDLGYRQVRLTTGDKQPEAVGLFRSAGYHEIAPFTDGAFTRHWMEKPLTPS